MLAELFEKVEIPSPPLQGRQIHDSDSSFLISHSSFLIPN